MFVILIEIFYFYNYVIFEIIYVDKLKIICIFCLIFYVCKFNFLELMFLFYIGCILWVLLKFGIKKLIWRFCLEDDGWFKRCVMIVIVNFINCNYLLLKLFKKFWLFVI